MVGQGEGERSIQVVSTSDSNRGVGVGETEGEMDYLIQLELDDTVMVTRPFLLMVIVRMQLGFKDMK
ncbi:hypothetical protein SUGI_0662910 [Cryptomeria japonica]|nr:hypothetical protein SUGI_0662910 [Cryptomeria japonica]